MHWIEQGPLWQIGLVLLVLLIAAQQAGYFLRRRLTRGKPLDEKHDTTGYLLSGVIGLMGLLLAFTFGAADSRFDARRLLVLQEANAIGTTYLRIQALDDAPRAELSNLMLRYSQARLAFFDAGDDRAKLAASYAQTDALQDRIWAVTTKAVRAQPGATMNVSLLETTNEMFDLAASRRAALEARIPITIVRALVIYMVVAAGIIGYGMAAGERQVLASIALFVALSMAFCLVLDLDRPRTGRIVIGQGPMLRAAASIQAAQVGRPAATP